MNVYNLGKKIIFNCFFLQNGDGLVQANVQTVLSISGSLSDLVIVYLRDEVPGVARGI